MEYQQFRLSMQPEQGERIQGYSRELRQRIAGAGLALLVGALLGPLALGLLGLVALAFLLIFHGVQVV
jgi:hypothetical protein